MTIDQAKAIAERATKIAMIYQKALDEIAGWTCDGHIHDIVRDAFRDADNVCASKEWVSLLSLSHTHPKLHLIQGGK